MDIPDTGRAVSTATESNDDDELGLVMAVVVRLRELRAQGFEHEEIARRVAVDHPRTPGGGTWSATSVDQVLRVADTSEIEHRRSVDVDGVVDGSESRPSPPRGPDQAAEVHHRPAVKVEHSRPVNDLSAYRTTASPPYRSMPPERPYRRPPPVTAQNGLRRSTGPDVEIEGHRYPAVTSRSRFGIFVGLLAVMAVAGVAYYFLSNSSDQTVTESAGTGRPISEEERTAASQALMSEVADGAEVSGMDQVSGEQSVDSTAVGGGITDPVDDGAEPDDQPPVVVNIDDLPQGDAADMLTIRVQGDDGEVAENGLSPATATIRTDGKLHVEGVFPNQAAADSFVAQATRIFGPEALVESYTVDPAAPRPTVSDVALDKPVLFESGSTEIHPDYIPFLEACAGVLEANSHIVMSVSAFTDSLGDEQFNLELSQQRARAIVEFYRDLDIGDAQLLGTGFGEDNPVADNANVQGREQNRRAMLQLLNIMDEG